MVGQQRQESLSYPDPDEGAEQFLDRIDMSELGILVNIREWRGKDGITEQFALMLNITASHLAYDRCLKLKGGYSNFSQVRRTDTWHSSIHSHQYYINSMECDREVHNVLYGGSELKKSRQVVNKSFRIYYNDFLYNPFIFLERWEEGRS